MQSKATSVEQYLAELPADRQRALRAVRKVILKSLDKDYEEGMQYGMIGYFVPHRVFPPGYHCDPRQPLPFAGLASQKNYMSLYLMCVYSESDTGRWFQKAWAKSGKKMDMGKCCVRFKTLDDLPLDVIAELIKRVPAKKFVEYYQTAMSDQKRKNTPKRKVAATKATGAAKLKKAPQ